MEKFLEEKLKEAINRTKNHSPFSLYIVMPQWWIEEESAAHPEYFRFDADGTMTWCGYIVYSYGDRYESD